MRGGEGRDFNEGEGKGGEGKGGSLIKYMFGSKEGGSFHVCSLVWTIVHFPYWVERIIGYI
jgi:hypothetical protein